MLDFRDVPRIGQAFADEIFRVFRRERPDVNITPIRTSQQVTEMIEHVLNSVGAIGNGRRIDPSRAMTANSPDLRP